MPSDIYAPRAQVEGLRPDHLTVQANLGLPWRLATVDGQALSGRIAATINARGTDSPVFAGEVDRPDAQVRALGRAVARGLPEWRKEIGPQTFQDVRLETVLQWLAGRCGGTAQIESRGERRRHYVLRRGPAWQLAREALYHWGQPDILTELDGGTLYIGPEARSPHALAGDQFIAERGKNIIELLVTDTDAWRVMLPLMPALRVGHRGTLDHPLKSGPVRITEMLHVAGTKNFTRLEVTTP